MCIYLNLMILIKIIRGFISAEFPLNRVEIANKNKILEELAQLNISESTVYPSMEKTAAEITKKFLSVS
ncbi:flagellar biosynthesis, FliO family protein [Escherichia coli]|nr:flagellar biosynthesis, FliO family protein [Escherichia coli]